MRSRVSILLLLALAVAGLGSTGTKEFRITLQLQPELDIEGTETVFVGPILLEPRSGEETQTVDLTAAREFEIYLRKILRRDARLHLVPENRELDLPSRTLGTLLEKPDFWKSISDDTDADLVVAASIDVKVLDRAGYTTEEYVSPQDGKTYFRQVMVEETGFSYDILLAVVSGDTGEILHQEQISDFNPRNERKLEEYTDMFSDLYTLQNRLVGIFVPRSVQVRRSLYTD